jgi:hypothetical protein
MTTLQYVAAGLAALVAAWPHIKVLPDVFVLPNSPDYQEAMANLAAVRTRLRLTDCLGEDQKKAIDVLTLALVDGSDE